MSHYRFESRRGVDQYVCLLCGHRSAARTKLTFLKHMSSHVLVPMSETSRVKMSAGNESRFTRVILNARVYEWVGIGWVAGDPPTGNERRTLPHVSQGSR